MFIRCPTILCVVALFFLAINYSSAGDVEPQALNPAVKIVAKVIAPLFTAAAAECLIEAAGNCKSNWTNPSKAISCAKDFLKKNHGRCAA